ncbi:hypothetical protein ABZP36_032237 [Zizania latifolia]
MEKSKPAKQRKQNWKEMVKQKTRKKLASKRKLKTKKSGEREREAQAGEAAVPSPLAALPIPFSAKAKPKQQERERERERGGLERRELKPRQKRRHPPRTVAAARARRDDKVE